MTNLKLYIIAILSMILAACGPQAPSFQRTVNLGSVRYFEVPDMPGSGVGVQIAGCSSGFLVRSCGAECGVRFVEFPDPTFPSLTIGYNERTAIRSSDMIPVLDDAKRWGCFEYGQPAVVTYDTQQYLPDGRIETHRVVAIETFIR